MLPQAPALLPPHNLLLLSSYFILPQRHGPPPNNPQSPPLPPSASASLGMFSKLLEKMGNVTSSQPKNKTGKKVVAQKIDIAQKTNVLSLTEHGLEEIPEQVYQCTSLKTLDLSKNKLTKLGKISQLKELKSFNCDENALTSNELAPLSNLTKLQSLSLGKNRLDNPSNMQFPALPATVKQLKIHGNSLSSIPKQICDPSMKLLEKLDLSFNNLAEVPAEICNLVALTELNLDNNVIVSLREELGQLTKLKTLSLKNNYIQVKSTNFSASNPQPIPASVFENTLLIDLNLHGNKLSSTQLNEFEGFEAFLERRKKVKSKNLYGGALVDMSVCGLT